MSDRIPVMTPPPPPFAADAARIIGSITSALRPPRLLVALVLVLLVSGIGRAWDAVAPARSVGGSILAPDPEGPGIGPWEATSRAAAESFTGLVRGVAGGRFDAAARSARQLGFDLPRTVLREHPAFAFFLLMLLIGAIGPGGGVLCRMAAEEVAHGRRVPPMEALAFALAFPGRLALAPALPVIVLALLASLSALLGLAFALPWLDVIAGALYGVWLLLGLLAAVVIVGFVAAGWMLVPAVACEACDAADAWPRAFAYAFSRPVRWLGCVAVGLVGLVVGYLLVATVVAAAIGFAGASASAWHGNGVLAVEPATFSLAAEPTEAPQALHARATAVLVAAWRGALIALVAAWVVSYLATAATSIYLVLRRACDGRDVGEIWTPALVPGTRAGTRPAPPTSSS